MFRDRLDAGRQLAVKLIQYKNEPGVILAIPRGGVPVAFEVAKEIKMPLELVLTKKIGHPGNKEYAIGADSLYDYFIVPHENVTTQYIEEELVNIRIRLNEMSRKFIKGKLPIQLKGKTIIIVDDGIATGNTLMGTVNLLKKSNPKKIVIAVPVASKTAFYKLSKEVDEIVALLIPEIFHGVGEFYEDFQQVTDEEVNELLDKINDLEIVKLI
jgi:predicted phosphoribosyltransferase